MAPHRIANSVLHGPLGPWHRSVMVLRGIAVIATMVSATAAAPPAPAAPAPAAPTTPAPTTPAPPPASTPTAPKGPALVGASALFQVANPAGFVDDAIWSDGTRLAYVETDGSTKATLHVVTLA